MYGVKVKGFQENKYSSKILIPEKVQLLPTSGLMRTPTMYTIFCRENGPWPQKSAVNSL